ncbi:MAG: hypothetical protein ABI353_02350 [Isosphaeraceae bacterium]
MQEPSPQAPAHDRFTRLLVRIEPDPETLWTEARGMVTLNAGVLVLDDSTLDKSDARNIKLVTKRGSGKHHKPVLGINLITLLWTDGDRKIPCDYRIDDQTKRRDQARPLRGNAPDCQRSRIRSPSRRV